MILEGLLKINDLDPWVEYGAFLSEDNPGDTANYSELLRPAAVKPQKEISLPDRDGVKTPAQLVQRRDARDVVLRFCIVAPDRAAFLARYRAFTEMLRTGRDGWLDVHLPELDRTFRMYYKECSEYSQLTDFAGEVAGRFVVRFREPQPER